MTNTQPKQESSDESKQTLINLFGPEWGNLLADEKACKEFFAHYFRYPIIVTDYLTKPIIKLIEDNIDNLQDNWPEIIKTFELIGIIPINPNNLLSYYSHEEEISNIHKYNSTYEFLDL